MKQFEKLNTDIIEIKGRFNSFVYNEFDDSLTPEKQMRALIKKIKETMSLTNEMVDYLNNFMLTFDKHLYQTVNDVLVKWAEDGILLDLVYDPLVNEFYAWFNEIKDMMKDEDLTGILERITELEKLKASVGYNITDFGCSVALRDNIEGIQKGIDYLHSLGGGKLIIPAGVFRIRPTVKTINLYDNISIIGDDKNNSILKVDDNWQDWNDIFYCGDKYISNVTISNFTIDENREKNIYTDKPVVWETARIPLFLRAGSNHTISNMILISTGVWVIRDKMKDSSIHDNHIISDLTSYEKWYDQSLIWFSGRNNFIYNNTIESINPSWNVGQTCIEFQGFNNKLYNNNLLNTKNGIIFTAATTAKDFDDIYSDPEWGSKDNKIYNNYIKAIRNGVEIWGMNFTEESVMKNNYITDNIIYMISSIYTGTAAWGIRFKEGNRGVQGHDGVQTSVIDGLYITGNSIEFDLRKIDITKETGQTGIRLVTEMNCNNITVTDNVIKNCGGQGITPHVLDWSNNWLRNIVVERNSFIDVLLPMRIYRNIDGLYCTNNSFIQLEIFNTYEHNMANVVIFWASSYPLNKKITIKDNFIKTNKYLKPFIPIRNSTIGEANFDISKELIISENEGKNLMTVENPLVPTTVGKGMSVLRTDGKFYAPLWEIGCTLGSMKQVNGDKIRFTKWLDENCIEVNNAETLKAGEIIKIPTTVFTGASAIIHHIINNRVYTSNNYFRVKEGIDTNIIESFDLDYYPSVKLIS